MRKVIRDPGLETKINKKGRSKENIYESNKGTSWQQIRKSFEGLQSLELANFAKKIHFLHSYMEFSQRI